MAYNDPYEIIRVQNSIADRRAQLENCYSLLGKQYVERHGSESDNEFAMLISTIIEHESILKMLDDQLLELRGLQRCTECGAEMLLTARFCNICGAKAPEPPAGKMRCPTCGKLLPEDAHFCNGCGNPVASVSYAPAATASAPAPAVKVCPACGASVAAECSFCTGCGAKL